MTTARLASDTLTGLRAMRLLRVVVAVSVLVSASAMSASASPQLTGTANAVNVQVDGTTRAFNATFAAYFPDEVLVHPGDTIVFRSVFRGSPHTVTLGSLVDDGLAAYEDAVANGPPGSPAPAGGYGPAASVDDHTIPQLAAIPDLVPPGGGDVNQSVAQPCFLDTGTPPGPGPTACPKRSQPAFTGTQSFYNSGWLPDGVTFTVPLASTIPPGTYHYMCAMHRSDMTGSFTVVPGHGPLYREKDFTANLAKLQRQGQADTLLPVVKSAGRTKRATVAAGVSSPDVDGPLATVFTPRVITIPLGGTVTWKLLGPHDIAFHPPRRAFPDLSRQADGSVHTNPLAWNPVGVPAAPAAPAGSSGPVVDAFKWDGRGFINTGVINSPAKIQVTFTAPGSYQYYCLIHTGMTGKVVVH